MQHIEKNKNNSPKSLEKHRANPASTYEDYKEKDDLRDVLLREQGNLCAYCLQRISKERMKIEHWSPQSAFPELQLDYFNLFAVCKGGEEKGSTARHCDTSKGNTEITINPSDPRCEELIKLNLDGRISSKDPKVDDELNTVLNLNTSRLVFERRKLLKEIADAYKQKKGDIKFLKQKLSEYTEKPYKPFARFVRDWIKKKITRQENKA